MPNWCYTRLRITSNNIDKLKELYSNIQEWTSKDYCSNGFGNNWLGNVVGNSGIAKCNFDNAGNMIKDFHTDKDESIACRGTLTELELENDEVIHIGQETAWRTMARMWVLICEKYLGDDYDITFDSEECGCGLYETNDPTIEGLYVIDIWGELPEELNWESDWDASKDKVIKFCQEALKTEETDIDKLLEMAEELDWVSIHKWEFTDVYECE